MEETHLTPQRDRKRQCDNKSLVLSLILSHYLDDIAGGGAEVHKLVIVTNLQARRHPREREEEGRGG